MQEKISQFAEENVSQTTNPLSNPMSSECSKLPT